MFYLFLSEASKYSIYLKEDYIFKNESGLGVPLRLCNQGRIRNCVFSKPRSLALSCGYGLWCQTVGTWVAALNTAVVCLQAILLILEILHDLNTL